MISNGNAAERGSETYRYRNVRPISTFGLAGLAAISTLGLVAGPHGLLVSATEGEVIGDPPDLRNVLLAIEDHTGLHIPGTPVDGEAPEMASVAVTLSGHDQNVSTE